MLFLDCATHLHLKLRTPQKLNPSRIKGSGIVGIISRFLLLFGGGVAQWVKAHHFKSEDEQFKFHWWLGWAGGPNFNTGSPMAFQFCSKVAQRRLLFGSINNEKCLCYCELWLDKIFKEPFRVFFFLYLFVLFPSSVFLSQ